jgi:hypothetical protein
MEASMTTEGDDDLQILRQGIHDIREEMVALKGIIRALLKHSSLTDKEIRSAVSIRKLHAIPSAPTQKELYPW